jgi:hypothetical protein
MGMVVDQKGGNTKSRARTVEFTKFFEVLKPPNGGHSTTLKTSYVQKLNKGHVVSGSNTWAV